MDAFFDDEGLIQTKGDILLKIDVQGHEMTVLQSGPRALSRVVAVQTELSFRPIYEGGVDWRDLIDWMSVNGFELAGLFPNNGGSFPLLVEMDGLFVRRELIPTLEGR